MFIYLRKNNFRIYYSPVDHLLENFYIPALSSSIHYDRSAGFFSSSALAVAAAGVAQLVQNGGRMRLLVGADLSEADVDAIRQGHDLKKRIAERLLDRFPDPQDALLKKRLEVLAWMVAEGTLEIKVVLPTDQFGYPIPASQSADYYHPKYGIFTDSAGDQVAFVGSINESETAWVNNYETFSVYFSWNETKPYLENQVILFERLWSGKEKDWIALEIPQAVKEKLLKYRPNRPPKYDPLEEPAEPEKIVDQTERLLFQFVRDAPHLIHAAGLGAATAAINPWPHQVRVADSVLRNFPASAMLCDEVGLGKTIEAGLILRQLLCSERVKKCLILTPKSVLKQWQEEMYEKFALDIPRYDGGKFWDVKNNPLASENMNPWDAFPILLAGSQLAKRAERRQQILSASGWDLLIVDEAHHARRKDFKERIYRPNRLLGLLREMNEQGKAASLLMMTATPMQVHPLEVWDLLRLLGLGGHWGADEDNFLNFFQEMRKPFEQVDWEFVYDLVKDYLETGGDLDSNFEAQVKADLGPVKWSIIKTLTEKRSGRNQTIKQLGAEAKPVIKEMARLHTPLRRYIYRNTRSLLREYLRLGILHENVPTRNPQIVRVEMRPEEYSLYQRIEEYITHFYQKYESERRGLGFVMTVYRRRLTSSFYAVQCSLERRLKFLKGEISPDKTFDDDDLEQDDLSLDVTEEVLSDEDRKKFTVELSYVKDFLHELRMLSIADSKLGRLKIELNKVFMQRSKVLVFTQYTDTMDYLRNQLVEVYGSQVACYSGRGGEIWNGIAWLTVSKEQVKREFGEGEIRIMICTDSASEGLNLQTCGVLINYDMPWNPMRVEQRIGRIDRIGQEYQIVWISNYFYMDTIEDIIYQRLSDRISWFEVVVGELQPILAEVGETTRRLAMLPAKEREAFLDGEIEALKDRLQNRELEALDLDDYASKEEYKPSQPTPVTLQDLEKLLTQSQHTSGLFQPHSEIKDAYLLNWKGGDQAVTFSPDCFDEHPYSVQFLTYGSALLKNILSSVPDPEAADLGDMLRFQTDDPDLNLKVWYWIGESRTEPEEIRDLVELRNKLTSITQPPGIADTSQIDLAQKIFTDQVNGMIAHEQTILHNRRRAAYLAEKARAQRILVKAALVEIALSKQPTLFDADQYPSAFNDQAIKGLQRHGYPWGTLLTLAYEPSLNVDSQDLFYLAIQGKSRESMVGHFTQLTEEAKQNVVVLNAVQIKQDVKTPDIVLEVNQSWYLFDR